MSEIYLDYNATTPCDPRVVDKMLPYFNQVYGNPANHFHRQGRMASRAVEAARQQVADFITAQAWEIYFTSGATESNNLAIFGVTRLPAQGTRRRIVTSQVEHKAILLPCKKLEEAGFEVIFLPVDGAGRVSVEKAAAVINDQTLLVTIQAANNEIGTLQPVAEIANIAHQHGALVHSDAAQMAGKLPIHLDLLEVDLLSLSAHKLYGPKGVGALYLRGGMRRIPLEPLLIGGGQESGLRSGTTNTPAIVGFGEACHIAQETLNEESQRIVALRDQLEQNLKQAVPTLRINGEGAARLPNTSSLTFPGIDADALLLNLPEVMMGTGSACNAGAIEPSHVLQALGLSRNDAAATIRASLGRYSTPKEIETAGAQMVEAWKKLTSITR